MFRNYLPLPSLKFKLSKKEAPAWPLKKGPIGSPETSVSNHLTPRNNPEDVKIQYNRGGDLRSRKLI
jgi:hypothetical protein